MGPRVTAIAPEQTLALRQQVLRPGQDLKELVFPGDLDSTSLHAGAFIVLPGETQETLVGVASVYQQELEGAQEKGLPDLAGAGSWRLRGMATDPRVRGLGLGGRLLVACIEHAGANEGAVLWCNARVNVAGFYTRHGFRVHGSEFELPRIGPHYLMWRDLR